MTILQPLPGFDWTKVRWGAPDEPRTEHCSYCNTKMRDDEMPLILSVSTNWVAEFCEACQTTWWGIDALGNHEEDF